MSSSDSHRSDAAKDEREAERFDPDRDGPDLAYEHIHRYLLAARLLKGLRVLDLAAGSGYGARLLEQAGCRVTALDLEPVGLGGLPRALCADGRHLPLSDGSFDAVVCFEAIEHVEDPEALVAEARRVLTGPSIFLVSTPDRAVYTDRVGHRNPHHVAEMNRREFMELLGRHFEQVRISGQSLWAGSWIAELDADGASPTASRRRITPLRWNDDPVRAMGRGAKWVSPDADELPVPVYLLAACSASTEGWAHIKRRLPSESLLHDPSQWLLAQYERLLEEGTARNRSLEDQIERAQAEHCDLSRQLSAARASIDLLEEEVRRSRDAADRQRAELDRARAGSEDQRLQLSLARKGQEDLKTQLAAAARASASHADEIERARAALAEKETRLVGVVESHLRLEEELRAARGAIGLQQNDLERAEHAAKDMEAQIDSARRSQADLEDQIVRARERILLQSDEIEHAGSALVDAHASIRALVTELDAARLASVDMEQQIEKARDVVRDQQSQIDRARISLVAREEEIEAARQAVISRDFEIDRARAELESRASEIESDRRRISGLETELETLRAEGVADRSHIDRLERASVRFWPRLGHRLADWVDGLRGKS